MSEFDEFRYVTNTGRIARISDQVDLTQHNQHAPEWYLNNIAMIARRVLSRRNSMNPSEHEEMWRHVERLCNEAGFQSSLLR